MYGTPIGFDKTTWWDDQGRGKEPGLQGRVVQIGGKRPGNPLIARRRQVFADHPLGQLQGPGDLALTQARLMVQAQHLTNETHG